jgi:hypothetical protein
MSKHAGGDVRVSEKRRGSHLKAVRTPAQILEVLKQQIRKKIEMLKQ